MGEVCSVSKTVTAFNRPLPASRSARVLPLPAMSHTDHSTEAHMGTKPSNNFQSDRPESGGADHDGERENSGLLEREKQKFATEKATERRDESPAVWTGEKRSSEAGEGSRDGESAE